MRRVLCTATAAWARATGAAGARLAPPLNGTSSSSSCFRALSPSCTPPSRAFWAVTERSSLRAEVGAIGRPYSWQSCITRAVSQARPPARSIAIRGFIATPVALAAA